MIVILPALAFFAAAFVAPPELEAVTPGDYDVPVSTAEQLRLGGTYAYAARGTAIETNDASASLLYRRYYNSLPYAWDLNFRGVGETRRTYNDEQEGSYELRANPGIRKYFDPEGDLFYSGEVRVTKEGNFDRPLIDFTPGVGSGRFIRVTSLAQAVRVEQFLVEEGVVKGSLPDETLVELAQVIERRDEFEAKFGDRYEVKWFEEMEKIVARSGQFAEDGFGAVGSLRVREVLFQERVNDRYTGWDVRTGVRFEALTMSSHVDRQNPGLSLRMRYSRPVGWISQVDVSAEYTSPFSGDFGWNSFTISTNLNYLYEVTNQVDFVISNDFTVHRWHPDSEAGVAETVRTGFLFFIENQINLNVTGALAKERGLDATQGLNVSVEYRLR